jgi:GNAT superfamily N-acetyltransferase
MSHDHEVIELSKINEPEYMEIVIKAFQDSPQVPVLIEKPKHTGIVIRNLLNMYKKSGSIKTFGIKKDKDLVCVGICIDSDSKPVFFRIILFGFTVLRTLGYRGVRQFWLYSKNKPQYEKRCLELIFYGTRVKDQQKGYGRSMLNFLYDYAKKNGYGGVTGATNTSRPAFQFYMRDGWIIDKQFTVEKYTICWVRRTV